MKKKLLSLRTLGTLLVSSLLVSGCATTITNLTPSTQKRNADSLYPFEVAVDTPDHRIRESSLKPYVLIGPEAYPLQPTHMLKNRWETLIPIPPGKEYVNYRYKFDYQYNSIPNPRPGSRLSRPYQLHIVD
jgi:hypothetical protein